jgi:protein-disulfide isomerase
MLHPIFRPDYDHYQGSSLAPIELVEYGDFQCEYCAAMYPAIKQLQDNFGHLLKFVYRHFPIPSRHALSVAAAVAAEAAASQGKFWHMHDMIYENQKYLTRRSFSGFAREIDLDTTSFEDCREHRKLFLKVISDFEGGVKSGVDSTPTFFINGVRYVGFDDFENLYFVLRSIKYYENSTTERSIRLLR